MPMQAQTALPAGYPSGHPAAFSPLLNAVAQQHGMRPDHGGGGVAQVPLHHHAAHGAPTMQMQMQMQAAAAEAAAARAPAPAPHGQAHAHAHAHAHAPDAAAHAANPDAYQHGHLAAPCVAIQRVSADGGAAAADGGAVYRAPPTPPHEDF